MIGKQNIVRLAIINSHPIQYNAPWFQHLAAEDGIEIKVFYLWDFGVTEKVDTEFNQSIKWDVPLLSGYDWQFVPNVSSRPGTDHFLGLRNPLLFQSVVGFDPDAVLVYGYNFETLLRFILRWKFNRIPLIFRGDSHRLAISGGIKERSKRAIISLIFSQYSAFLCVGKANKRYFQYHRVSQEKLFFAPHSVDNDRFIKGANIIEDQASLWKNELNIPSDQKIILFAGKFEPHKRPLDLLRAFLIANLSNVTLLFVGSGILEETLRAEAEGNQNIRFASFQNQTMMPRIYAVADLVVLPSMQETWGLVVNEAMCLSKPIIVSNKVGCAEDIVRPYKNGLIFTAGDVADLARCLQEAFSDLERLREWGKKSRRIIDEYSYVQATNGLKEALTYLSARRNGRARKALPKGGNDI